LPRTESFLHNENAQEGSKKYSRKVKDTVEADGYKAYGIETEYKGSLPKRIKGYRSTLVDRMTMQIKLEEALAAEEYEKAALYRDYLKVLNHDAENPEEQ